MWSPLGGGQWVGIYFCHPEVVKLQQQYHMQNTIFDLPQTTGSINFFFWKRESANILETATGELEGKMKMTIQWESGILCSSIITLMFAFLVSVSASSKMWHINQIFVFLHLQNKYVKGNVYTQCCYRYHYLFGKPTHPFNALCVIYPHVEVAF